MKGGETGDELDEIYNRDQVEDLLNDDEISPEEAGFMKGYNTQ